MKSSIYLAAALVLTLAANAGAASVRDTCRDLWGNNTVRVERCVDRWIEKFGKDSLGSGGLDSGTISALSRARGLGTSSPTRSPLLESISEFFISVTWLAFYTPFGYLFVLIAAALALLALFMPIYICLIFHQSRKMRAELERLNATLRQVAGRLQPEPVQKQKSQDT